MQQGEVTKARMYTHIEQWKGSGLSQKAYCQSNAIIYHVFHYWYKLYRSEHLLREVKPAADFIPLQIHSAATGCMELCFINGHRILFHQMVSADYLKALIS